MTRKRPRNGWYFTQRKDSKGNLRPYAILMKNGIEIKHKILRDRLNKKMNLAKDQQRNSEINIEGFKQSDNDYRDFYKKDEEYKEYLWENVGDQVDFNGLDTKK
jgi:hypothetical protein